MRNILSGLALAGLMSTVAPAAHAQLNLEISNVDPLTKLSAEKWAYLVTHVVNATPLLGKDSVYAINATGEDVNVVVCRGYQLVGPKPYITNNKTTNAPSMLPKWTVTLIPTESFNDYCKNGVDGNSNAGSYHAVITSSDKTFANATFITFMKPD